MFDREQAIEELINDDINLIKAGDDYYLDLTLRCGFVGYEKYSDERLMQELTERDISYLFGETE